MTSLRNKPGGIGNVILFILLISAVVLTATPAKQQYTSHLSYYENALTSHQEALLLCERQLHQFPIKKINSTTKEGKQFKDKYSKLVTLRNHFVSKVFSTTEKLAVEYEKSASEALDNTDYTSSLAHLENAANHWETLAQLYENESYNKSKSANYFGAATLQEKAFNIYKKAQACWQQYTDYSHSMKAIQHQEVDEKIKLLFFKGLDALRAAKNAYHQASQFYLHKAMLEKIRYDNLNNQLGKNWEIAGQAAENFGRIMKMIRELEDNMLNSHFFSE